MGIDSWVVSVVESLSYWGVLLLMAGENVFPPIPSELIMPLAGYTAAKGNMMIWLAILAGSIGTLLGTLPWYVVARWVGKERLRDWVSRHGHWLTIDVEDIDRATDWFARHANLFVLFGRLIPGVRTVVSIPAGFCAMGLGRFVAFSALGTVAWTAALAAGGYALGKSYDQISTYLGPVVWVLLGMVLLWYIVRLVKMKRSGPSAREASA